MPASASRGWRGRSPRLRADRGGRDRMPVPGWRRHARGLLATPPVRRPRDRPGAGGPLRARAAGVSRRLPRGRGRLRRGVLRHRSVGGRGARSAAPAPPRGLVGGPVGRGPRAREPARLRHRRLRVRVPQRLHAAAARIGRGHRRLHGSRQLARGGGGPHLVSPRLARTEPRRGHRVLLVARRDAHGRPQPARARMPARSSAART
jgi:hypothetical protein